MSGDTFVALTALMVSVIALVFSVIYAWSEARCRKHDRPK